MKKYEAIFVKQYRKSCRFIFQNENLSQSLFIKHWFEFFLQCSCGIYVEGWRLESKVQGSNSHGEHFLKIYFFLFCFIVINENLYYDNLRNDNFVTIYIFSFLKIKRKAGPLLQVDYLAFIVIFFLLLYLEWWFWQLVLSNNIIKVVHLCFSFYSSSFCNEQHGSLFSLLLLL